MYSSASVGSTSYFVVYAEIASQVENRQGADQRYLNLYGTNVGELKGGKIHVEELVGNVGSD